MLQMTENSYKRSYLLILERLHDKDDAGFTRYTIKKIYTFMKREH